MYYLSMPDTDRIGHTTGNTWCIPTIDNRARAHSPHKEDDMGTTSPMFVHKQDQDQKKNRFPGGQTMKKFSMTLIIAALSVTVIPAAAWAQSPLAVDEFSEFSAPAAQQPKADTPRVGKETVTEKSERFVAGETGLFGIQAEAVSTDRRVEILVIEEDKPVGRAPGVTPGGEKPSQATSTTQPAEKPVLGSVMIEAGGGNLSDYSYADYGFVRIGAALDFPVHVSHGIAVNASLGYQPERGAGMLFRNAWGSANETRLTLMGGYAFRQDDAFSLRLLVGPSYDFTNGDLALDFGAEASGHPGDFIVAARFFGHVEDDRYNTLLTQLEGLYDLKVARVGLGLDLLSLQDLGSVSNDWRWGVGLSAVADFVIAERYIIGGSFGVMSMDGFASAGPFGAGRVGIQF